MRYDKERLSTWRRDQSHRYSTCSSYWRQATSHIYTARILDRSHRSYIQGPGTHGVSFRHRVRAEVKNMRTLGQSRSEWQNSIADRTPLAVLRLSQHSHGVE